MEQVKKVGDGMFEVEMNETLTISFKLEEELLKQVDEAVKNLGYSNRSDLIRDAILEYISYLEGKRDGNS
ncbi:ribbon-helix-helix domain-containing protein [Acidianus sp. HS-5]|uniref:ribbon-helix-helix domain-containing protein n=1 Tax=Acidianus sp. HS-5 TaxID=2886040 RepID=UPI001F3DCE05|nr:ribbon-helix-helix domain-containing protein [Acidianus sp. HS-5]BDC18039.1 CopG family transcriptional regulator [Acidianus sp. HS-5]